MATLSSRRYEVHRVLGKGGMGVVYEAYDSKHRNLVALKTIEPGHAEHLYRLKHEFRALADVEHRNIVRFVELSHEDGRWFFSMELVRGQSFIDYVRPQGHEQRDESGRTAAVTTILQNFLPDSVVITNAAPPALSKDVIFDEGRLRAALAQLVSALSAIHDAGHVHRDVKPSNVLVSEEGRVVLLDFGLVQALGASGAREVSDLVVGTPAFMAPEQLSGEAGGPEVDWYALGVILYVALTGAYPFEGSAANIYAAKREQEPLAPSAIAHGVPPDLDALCVELLRRLPSERPSGAAMRARLGVVAPPSAGSLPALTPFVGRAADLAALAHSYADVRAGRGRRVIVEGDPGVGKSALVQHFLSTAPGDPIVLAGRCYEQESVPFKGFDSVVDSLSEHLIACDTATSRDILSGGVRSLATIFPVLARVPDVGDTMVEVRTVEGEAGLREQAFRELERLFDALARRGPLVVHVDDVQWADADSLALFRRLLLRPNAAPCYFIATLRSGMESPELSELSKGAERIVLRGLDDAESRALWDSLSPGAFTPRATALREAAVKEAAGHPLFLAELALAARSGHAEPGRLRLEDVLWRRVQERDPIEQRFIEMLAFAGAPTPCEVVARAAGLDTGECVTRLGGLRAAQLVRVTRRGEERIVEAYHDRIRESVVEHLKGEGSARETARHLALGRALRQSAGAASLPQPLFALLKHLDAARALITTSEERLDVARLHLAASGAARLATAYARARYHAIEGLALATASGWVDAYALTRDLWIERMEAEYLGGRPSDARASFEAAREKLTSTEDKTALYVAWIALESTHLHFVDALAAGREILAALGAPLPARASMAHVLGEFTANRVARGLRPIDDLLDLPPLRDPVRESTMKILMALGPAAYVSDTNLFTWSMLRIAGISMRHGISGVSSYGFAGYGLVLSTAFGKHREGAAFGRVALVLNERFKNESLAGKLHFIDASYLAPWTRPMSEAREALQRAHDESIRNGDRAYEIYSVLHMSMMAFFEGTSLETLQATGERGQEISVRRREADIVDDSNSILARYAAYLRDLGEGMLTASVNDKSIMTSFFYHYCGAEIAYVEGDFERAARLLRAARDAGYRAIFGTIMVVEVAWLEALVAARRWDTAALSQRPKLVWTVGSRVRKLERLAKSQSTNFEAHYLLADAEWMRVTGRAARARETIARAIEVARERGAPKREAIALDIAADYARRDGDGARAYELAQGAREAYARWGAMRLARR